MNKIQNEIAFIFKCLVVIFLGIACKSNPTVETVDLRCEYRVSPLGIDNVNPRLSWRMIDADKTRGQKQTAYQVLVASSLKNLEEDNGDLWDSGKQLSDQSVNVVYQGAALHSGQACYWKVRVWDVNAKVLDWSNNTRFTIGLLNPEDWKGEWILKKDQLKTDHNWYRKNFELNNTPESALVYVASFGYHELYVNGQKVGNEVMNPVSSFMKTRIPYLTYDIKDLLKKGDNVIAVWHAAGWARWNRVTEYMNPPFVFKAQIELQTNSEKLSFCTDTSWKCQKSYSSYYGDWDILDFGGEIIDERLREDDWNAADYNDSNWLNASIYNPDVLNANIKGNNISIALNSNNKRYLRKEYGEITASLSSQMVEPQVKYQEINPIGVSKNTDGTYLVDMGENYTGYFVMNLFNGVEGDSVLFEIADQEGITSSWKQKSKYIYGITGEGYFTNRFNVSGGRWVTVYGLSYEPELKDIKGYIITNNRKRISRFECSDTLLNQIYEVNLRTYIANTMDGILVDCPHRERRGWGEVTVAAMYGDALPNFESGAYMDQYAQYMRDAQFSDGRIRAVLNEQDRPFLMWKANSPVTIWETYKMLGDKKMLQDNYASMQEWMTWMHNSSNYKTGGALKIGTRGKREMPGLGDWCTPRGNFWDSSNSPDAAHFNNCVYAYMLDCALKMAEVLGKTDDAKIFADRLSVQQKATHEIAYDPTTGKYLDGKQVDQAFALLTGVTPEHEREKVISQLEENVLYTFPYYDTGSSGQALYTRYFIEGGERMDLVYELLQDTRHPSYGYFIRQGKTTWPERWSAVGNSQIHTCYTGIGGYFIKGFGGIRAGEKGGMQNFIIKPAPVGDLKYANTTFESLYGKVVVNWKRTDVSSSYHIEIPPNTSAKVYIPAADKLAVMEGNLLADNIKNISYVGTEKSDAVGNYVVYKLKSGSYNFTVNKLPKVFYPNPLYNGSNLSKIGRISASSMFIVSEKNPGFEAFNVNDDDIETSWQAGDKNNQWLEVSWIKPQTFNSVVINEIGNRITKHKIQYWGGGQWQDIVEGTVCGANKEYVFKTIFSTKCRVYVSEASEAAAIAEFKILNLDL